MSKIEKYIKEIDDIAYGLDFISNELESIVFNSENLQTLGFRVGIVYRDLRTRSLNLRRALSQIILSQNSIEVSKENTDDNIAGTD